MRRSGSIGDVLWIVMHISTSRLTVRTPTANTRLLHAMHRLIHLASTYLLSSLRLGYFCPSYVLCNACTSMVHHRQWRLMAVHMRACVRSLVRAYNVYNLRFSLSHSVHQSLNFIFQMNFERTIQAIALHTYTFKLMRCMSPIDISQASNGRVSSCRVCVSASFPENDFRCNCFVSVVPFALSDTLSTSTTMEMEMETIFVGSAHGAIL